MLCSISCDVGWTAYRGNSRKNVKVLKFHSKKASLNIVAVFSFESNNKYFRWWCPYCTDIASFPGTEQLFSGWRMNYSNFCGQSAANKESHWGLRSDNLFSSPALMAFWALLLQVFTHRWQLLQVLKHLCGHLDFVQQLLHHSSLSITEDCVPHHWQFDWREMILEVFQVVTGFENCP